MAHLHFPGLAERVWSQQEQQPHLYGDIDFELAPYRLATEPDDESSLPSWVADRTALLQDERLVELVSTATLLGDVVADPYASLMAERPFKGLIDLLQQACRHGIDAVPDAPPELRALIAAMEDTPDWVDMDLVHEGSRLARPTYAFLAPFLVRGGLFATFTNTYAALPMALTGALGGRKAARRANETASFFAITTLPGALERHGPGFEAAAMVRLMHSMVRYNALKRSDRWDPEVFGIPVPQIDQVPAGLLGIYLLAADARRKGRDAFTDDERAVVEFNRYRCFLLGLPEELLPSTVEDVLAVMHARAALLRDDFDDDTCGALIRATMAARLRPGTSPVDDAFETVERAWSKVFFLRAFANGNRDAARRMGVPTTAADLALVTLTAPLVTGQFLAMQAAVRSPLRPLADAYTLTTLKGHLATYGRPEFTTDASAYTPTVRVAAAAAA